nr:MAG TPA: hypothetical protein [Caudoviricetes sp.]
MQNIQTFLSRILKGFCNTDGNRYTYIIVTEVTL